MRRLFPLLFLAVTSLMVAGCGAYANTVEGDVSVPRTSNNNPDNLPDPDHVPKPDTPHGYPVSVSPVTIEEVSLAGAQWIELFNASAFDVDLGGWTILDGFGSFTFPYGFHLAAGSRVIVHAGQAGFDTQDEQFAPSLGNLPLSEGSLALVRGSDLMDFIQWGRDGQAFEVEASLIGEWLSGDYVPTPGIDESLQYDGTANDSSAWHLASPTPGN